MVRVQVQALAGEQEDSPHNSANNSDNSLSIWADTLGSSTNIPANSLPRPTAIGSASAATAVASAAVEEEVDDDLISQQSSKRRSCCHRYATITTLT
jgi:hypothetical protein